MMSEYMIMSCNIADALREGREEGVRDTARKMKTKGASLEFIMDTTGLNFEDIEKL